PATGRLLFFSATVERIRLQAAELVSALDGPPRRARSWRVAPRLVGETDRAARHARDPRRTLPAFDALHEPRLADGARHHRVAACPRSGRSGQVRLLALPPRHATPKTIDAEGGARRAGDRRFPATAFAKTSSVVVRSTCHAPVHDRTTT